MLDPTQGNLYSVDVDFKLDDRQRATMCAAVQQEAFDVMQHVMEAEVRKFNIALVNTDVTDSKAVLANHAIAKAAAQFYIGFISRLREELQLQQYNAARLGTIDNPESSAVSPDFE